MLLPAFVQAKTRAQRIQCVSDLRQTGIGFHSFAHDHNDKFPQQVPASSGGSQDFAQNAARLTGNFYFAFRHFQALSNELVTPKLLACPADDRSPAINFAFLKNDNLSYFISLSASMSRPNSILAGDRNVTNDWLPPSTILQLGATQFLRWTHELHHFKGDLLFADGHVAEMNSLDLRQMPSESGRTAAFFTPTTKPPNVPHSPDPPPSSPGSRPTAGTPLPGSAPMAVSSSPKSNSPGSDQNKSSLVTTAPAVQAGPGVRDTNETNTLKSPVAMLNASNVSTNPLPITNSPGVASPNWPLALAKPAKSGIPWLLYLLLLFVLLILGRQLRQRILQKRDKDSLAAG